MYTFSVVLFMDSFEEYHEWHEMNVSSIRFWKSVRLLAQHVGINFSQNYGTLFYFTSKVIMATP